MQLQREFDKQNEMKETNEQASCTTIILILYVDEMDEDYALALQLQMEEEQAAYQKSSKQKESTKSILISNY